MVEDGEFHDCRAERGDRNRYLHRKKAKIAATSLLAGGLLALIGVAYHTHSKRQNTPIAARTLPQKITKQFTIGPGNGQESRKTIDLVIPREEYLKERNTPKTHETQSDLNYYKIRHRPTDELADILKSAPENCFVQATTNRPTPDYERVLQFMRTNLTYQRDSGDGYAKHPVETLVENGGDCEDLAILAAALLRKMDRKFAPIYEPRHVTLAIQLHEKEEPPQRTRIYLNKLVMPVIVNNNLSLQPVDFPFTIIEKPAMYERNGKRYFAIEVTNTQLDHIKSDFAIGCNIVLID